MVDSEDGLNFHGSMEKKRSKVCVNPIKTTVNPCYFESQRPHSSNNKKKSALYPVHNKALLVFCTGNLMKKIYEYMNMNIV